MGDNANVHIFQVKGKFLQIIFWGRNVFCFTYGFGFSFLYKDTVSLLLISAVAYQSLENHPKIQQDRYLLTISSKREQD